MNLEVSQLFLSWERERKCDWVDERETVTEKIKYFCLRFRHGQKPSWLYSSLFYYSLQAGYLKKRDITKCRGGEKSKNIFACVVVIVRKGFDFNFPCFIIPFKLGAGKRETE